MALTAVVAVLLVVAGMSALSGRHGKTEVDEPALRAALHDKLHFSQDKTRIQLGPTVPGVLVFSAYETTDPRSRVTGVFDGSLHTDSDASISIVLAALRFGEVPADPQVVAGAVGMLEGNPGAPFLTTFAIEQSGNPNVMTLPRVVTVDGQQAVEYWNMTARRTPWRTQVLQRSDGGYEVRQGLPEAGK